MDVFCTDIAYYQYWGDQEPSSKCTSFEPYFEFGDLQKGIFSEERFRQVRDLLEDDWTYDFSCLKGKWNELQSRQDQILEETKKDGELYVWHDRSANDALTLRYLCHLIRGKNISVYSVSPESEYRPLAWSEIEIEEFKELRQEAVLLGTREVDALAGQWDRIAKDSSLLRYKTWDSVECGTIDHFDVKIRDRIPASPFRAGQAIGNLIGETNAFDVFLPFIEKRLCMILRSDFEYEIDKEDVMLDIPYLYKLTFTKMKKGIRLYGGEYSKRLEGFSYETLLLISELNASTKDKALKKSDITTNAELSEDEVVDQLRALLEQEKETVDADSEDTGI